MKLIREKMGFTVIEILIVIAIIAVLAVVIFVSVEKSQAKSRDSRRMSDVTLVRNAVALYGEKHEGYPQSSQYPYGCGFPQSASGDANCLKELTNDGLIATLPRDPRGASYGFFDYSEAGSDYGALVRTNLESYGENRGLPGSCRIEFHDPSSPTWDGAENWCEKLFDQTDWCLCLPSIND